MEENLTKAQKIKIEQAANALLAELEQAKNINDESQIKNIKQELDAIEKSLREVYDATLTILEKNKAIIKVRENVFRKNVKNARVNVRNNLSNAYRDIGKDLPELERHLRQCIDTKATYAVYDPEKAKTDKSISWHIFW